MVLLIESFHLHVIRFLSCLNPLLQQIFIVRIATCTERNRCKAAKRPGICIDEDWNESRFLFQAVNLLINFFDGLLHEQN